MNRLTSKLAAAAALAVLSWPVTAQTATAATTGARYVIASATAFDGSTTGPTSSSRTVTLPLRRGAGPDGRAVGYLITESSDAADAAALGVNYAPKLAHALGTAAVQHVTSQHGRYRFSGGVDFSPKHVLVPGAAPDYFPPTRYAPGAVGDSHYSPLVTAGDGIVRNAPQVLNASGYADALLGVDPTTGTATLGLIQGFYEGHPVLYIRTESSDKLVAAVEDSTWAPNLASAPGLGSDNPSTSAREAIIPITNGQTGSSNPQRQGLNSLLAGDGSPLNIIQEEPAQPGDRSALAYSPIWDVSLASWTDATPVAERLRLTSTEQVRSLAASGTITSSGTAPVNPSIGLHPSGAVSLCPVVAVLSP